MKREKVFIILFSLALLLIFSMSVVIYKEERHGHWMLHFYQRHFDPQIPDVTDRGDYWCIQGWTGTLKKLNIDCDICFFGHSQIAGIDFQSNYPNLKMVTLGYPGDNAEGMILRVEQVQCVKPEKVFFMCGVNSLWYKDEVFAEDYEAIIDSINRAIPSVKLYVLNILPECDGASGNSLLNEKIRYRNEYISECCARKNITLVDLYPAFSDEFGNLRQELSIDGVHINADGYEVLRQVLDPYILE